MSLASLFRSAGGIRPRITVIEKDLGLRRIMRQIKLMKRSHVKVGLPQGGSTEGRYTMAKLIQAADATEFGKGVPERSFMRSAIDQNMKFINSIIEQDVNLIMAGRLGVSDALDDIGGHVKLAIVRKIMTGPFKPLSKITVMKKGHSVPLFETGQLINSIQYKKVVK